MTKLLCSQHTNNELAYQLLMKQNSQPHNIYISVCQIANSVTTMSQTRANYAAKICKTNGILPALHIMHVEHFVSAV